MLLPTITPKQKELLILLYRFRFLNRHHLQKFLNHKDPRRLNEWLKDLTEKKLVGRIYSQTIGENTKPAIYYLDSKCLSILKSEPVTDKRILKRVYRERLRSKRLRDHCLLIADLCMLFSKQAKDTDNLHFFTSTDLLKHTYLPSPHPDAYIALESTQTTKRYFLEIVDPETPRFALRSKLDRYFEYVEENTWTTTTGHPFPKILVVCPSASVHYYLKSYLGKKLEEELSEIQFYLTTSSAITLTDPITWDHVV